MPRSRDRRWSPGRSALLLGWAAIGISYLLLTPPGGPSDEGAHLVRAVGVVHGDVLGGPPRHPPVLPPPERGDPRSLAWLEATSRSQQVPAWLTDAPLFPCFVPQPQRLPASCGTAADARTTRTAGRIDTWVGTYPPYAYAVLGLPALVVSSPDAAVYAGRALTLACWLGLMVLALWLVPGGGLPWLAVGVPASLVAFGAQLNPSGLEVPAAVVVWAALLALRRDPDRRAVVALAVAGVVLVLSRELGLLWLLAAAAVVGGVPRRAGLARLRRLPMMGPALGVLVLAAGLAVGWSLWRGPHPERSSLRPPSPGTAERMVREYAGSFGFSDVTPPVGPFLLWAAVMVGLAVVLLRHRGTRAVVVRWALAVYAATWVTAVATSANGFLTVGRYVAPVLAGLFVLAAFEVVRPPRWAVAAAALSVAAIHVVGLLAVAYRYGHGGIGVGWPSADWPWDPPGGWPIALGVGLVGAVLSTVGCLEAGRSAAVADAADSVTIASRGQQSR